MVTRSGQLVGALDVESLYREKHEQFSTGMIDRGEKRKDSQTFALL